MVIKGWLFKTAGGLELNELSSYSDEVKQLVKDFDLPDNAFSYAKVTLYQEISEDVIFTWKNLEIKIDHNQLLGFQIGERHTSNMAGSESDGNLFYILDGEEYSLKKNQKQSQDLKIVDLLQKLK